jgi:hypothetical protein
LLVSFHFSAYEPPPSITVNRPTLRPCGASVTTPFNAASTRQLFVAFSHVPSIDRANENGGRFIDRRGVLTAVGI